jgi:hypothetical protein
MMNPIIDHDYAGKTIIRILNPDDPFHTWKVRADRFLLNDVCLPWESGATTYGIRPWIIGNEMGPSCVVWARSIGDALDEAADSGFLDADLVDMDEYLEMTEAEQGDYSCLGSASEPYQAWYWWYRDAWLEYQPTELLCLISEARGADADTLEELV